MQAECRRADCSRYLVLRYEKHGLRGPFSPGRHLVVDAMMIEVSSTSQSSDLTGGRQDKQGSL